MPGGSTHPGNEINNPSQHSVKNRSKFGLGKLFLNGERFGDISLCYATDTVRTDRFFHRISGKVNSYTLKTPFVGTIRKHRSSIHVPLSAILPLNFDKVIKQPVQGDDIPDGVNCAVRDFPYKASGVLRNYLGGIWSVLFREEDPLDITDASAVLAWFKDFFKVYVLGSYFFSPGSLLTQAGYSCWKMVRWFKDPKDAYSLDHPLYMDDFLDGMMEKFSSHPFPFALNETAHLTGVVAWRRFLELILDEPAMIEDLVGNHYFTDNVSEYLSDLPDWFNEDFEPQVNWVWPVSNPSSKSSVLNFGRLASYQIACHHYFSNDHIDYIFSADLYRQLMGSYITEFVSDESYGPDDLTFFYNGLQFNYDYLSGYYFDLLIQNLGASALWKSCSSYFAGIFSFRHSLRYVDYFVGARTRPLAVGNYDVPVVGAGVSIIDVIHQNAAARLANFTNRARNRVDKWLEAMFPGVSVPYDYHNPQFLLDKVSAIYGQVTENTGEAQYKDVEGVDVNTSQVSRTSEFYGSDRGEFAYEFSVDVPGYLIVLSYYDISRVYTSSIERQMMAYDRMDMFQPFMQYVGDQPIYSRELDCTEPADAVFGYQAKDMQYKQAYNTAAGPFAAGKLPSWFFDDSYFLAALGTTHTISPSSIRSMNGELDKFYLTLTGFTLSTYFHFICQYENEVSASRPMAFNPGIL